MFTQLSLNGEYIELKKYFISSITEISRYNGANTTVYGLLLSITAIIVYGAVKKIEYKINLNLFLVFLPLSGIRIKRESTFVNHYLKILKRSYNIGIEWGYESESCESSQVVQRERQP